MSDLSGAVPEWTPDPSWVRKMGWAFIWVGLFALPGWSLARPEFWSAGFAAFTSACCVAFGAAVLAVVSD